MEINPSFSQKLLVWYRQNARRLPWRGLADPYAIWVSEIMAQQTRVETVIPYFTRWMGRFPTVETLAAATEQEVLSMWEGLGYYGRARSLLKAARIVTVTYGGQLPRNLIELERLPGIGRYTAAAVCSIAFGQSEPVLDGNVKRVLSRVFDIATPVNTPGGEKQCWNLAEKLIPSEEPGDYNQAMMELGATLCTPRSPACPL
jgi:A/G-specific adenine glycosylase